MSGPSSPDPSPGPSPGAPPDPPVEPPEVALMRAQRDDYARRAREAETLAEALADELAATRERLAAAEADPGPITIFDGAPEPAGPVLPGTTLPAEGGDRAVLPLALGATALVAALVGLLSLGLGGLPLGLVMLVVAAALGWGAWRTRVVPASASIEDGVAVVRRGGEAKRFDVTGAGVRLDVRGHPGDPDWRVRFYRRGLDPVDVDATMTDPTTFMTALREHRPGL